MILEEMSMKEFEQQIKKHRTVIIPFGSLEAHGPHLPLGTDTTEVYEIAKGVARSMPVFVAPPLPYGVCRSTSRHPGTVGIAPDTLRLCVRDVVKGLYANGLRKFAIISGHASSLHLSALEEAGESLLGEMGPQTILHDRENFEYIRVYASKRTVVGSRLSDLAMPAEAPCRIVNIRRGDAHIVPDPDLILEFGDQLGLLAELKHAPALRAHFGDSIKGTTEFSYVSIGIGMVLGVILGLIPVPVQKVRDILRLNSSGKRPDKLLAEPSASERAEQVTFQNMAGQESINRFDKSELRKRKKNPRSNFRRGNK